VVFNLDADDYGDRTVASDPVYGHVQRVVIESTGSETAWGVELKDAHGVSLFKKMDLSTALDPYSFAISMPDTLGTSFLGAPVHGPLTLLTTNVGYDTEVQTLTADAAAINGTFTLTYGGQTTSALAYNANAATIKAALEALSTVNANDIAVAGTTLDSGGPLTFTFIASLGNVSLLTIDDSALGAVQEVQTLTSDDAIAGTFTLTWGDETTTDIPFDASTATIQTALEALDGVASGDITVGGQNLAATGDTTFTFRAGLGDVGAIALDTSTLGKTQEVQTLTIDAPATEGTWTLTFGGQTTTDIAYNAATSAVKTALEALSTVEVDDIAVGGSALSAGGPMTFTFIASLGDVADLTVDDTGLIGPTTSGVVETTPGELVAGSFGETVKGVLVDGAIATTTEFGSDLTDITVTVYYLGNGN
jgi:hypothetical protein